MERALTETKLSISVEELAEVLGRYVVLVHPVGNTYEEQVEEAHKAALVFARRMLAADALYNFALNTFIDCKALLADCDDELDRLHAMESEAEKALALADGKGEK